MDREDQLTPSQLKIIESCLLALSYSREGFVNLINSLQDGESGGWENAAIYLDSRLDNDWFPEDFPICEFEFFGVCFEYLDQWVVVSLNQGEKYIQEKIASSHPELNWSGFPRKDVDVHIHNVSIKDESTYVQCNDSKVIFDPKAT